MYNVTHLIECYDNVQKHYLEILALQLAVYLHNCCEVSCSSSSNHIKNALCAGLRIDTRMSDKGKVCDDYKEKPSVRQVNDVYKLSSSEKTEN